MQVDGVHVSKMAFFFGFTTGLSVLVLSVFLVHGTSIDAFLTFEVNGNKYAISDHWLEWGKGRVFCKTINGSLAKFTSEEHYKKVVKQLLKMSFRFNACVSIGASDQEKEGTWIWEDGEAVTFSRWQPESKFEQWFLKYRDDCANLCVGSFREDYWWKRPCFAESQALCDIPNKALPSIQGKTPEHIVVFRVLQDFAGLHLLGHGEWMTQTYTASSCGRKCLENNCKYFSFCKRTGSCIGVSKGINLNENTIPGEQCGIWEAA